MKERLNYFTVASLIFVLDQFSKSWASTLQNRPGVPVIDGFFHFSYVENAGIAWGLFSDAGLAGKVVLGAISVVAALGIFLYAIRTPPAERITLWGLSLVLGGVLGNLTDRVARGAVFDFLDFTIGNYKWPTFNLADLVISLGAVILIVDALRSAPDQAPMTTGPHRPNAKVDERGCTL